MTLWVCQPCGTKYAVDAPSCPHCGGSEPAEEGTEAASRAVTRRQEGSDMPKITMHGGAEPPEVIPEEPETEAAEEGDEDEGADASDDGAKLRVSGRGKVSKASDGKG